VVQTLFPEQREVTLDKAWRSFLINFMKDISALMLAQRDIPKEREQHNGRLEKIVRNNKFSARKFRTVKYPY
jgi:hypothetical protein